MNKNELLKKIKTRAKEDAKKRLDVRFKQTMGFLVAKGFLQINYAIPRLPNQRLKIEDAIWAGRNVEPRILEVLPAAILRLEKHFDIDKNPNNELTLVLTQLRKNCDTGDNFCGIPYEKIKKWTELKLKDGRTKVLKDKKVIRTFRLTPMAIQTLEKAAKKARCSVTEALEKKILSPNL